MSGELDDALERIVDKHDMRAVLYALSRIAYGKAQHLVENWQDENTAKLWNAAGIHTERAARNVEV